MAGAAGGAHGGGRADEREGDEELKGHRESSVCEAATELLKKKWFVDLGNTFFRLMNVSRVERGHHP